MDAIPERWIRDLEDYPRIISIAWELVMATEI
jgi:hypothetical protein